ncbi:MgtC/SapB family protein [Atopomonas sediminilitoris]|uniref:MgtC/SapB family protein n=1 Tax=Atopomonas sediminilitoris TaxID=2919919 RepID=UPI001F4EBDE4|nr:MgtC/SapB family protein [Atopomonas sediminilitoris]MCJ8170143.1 MgtC/SapB family protein [Atopomonas sediminilitoris]
MPETLDWLTQLALALGIGLLIGTERGWQARNEDDLRVSAGIRTFGLTGLLGGLSALLSHTPLGLPAWLGLFLAFASLVALAYYGDLQRNGQQGLTSEVALLLTYLLGSLALFGYPIIAAAGAVVTALLLSLKPMLHNALKRLDEQELTGALKLLFISVVLLPALPNQGYGPWQVFNPYAIWWMVVLIAALGFAAYVAVRWIGERRGLLLTAALGGIVSSTAMTLTLARLGKSKHLTQTLACGLLITSCLMFPRVLLEVAFINPALLAGLSVPLGLAAASYLVGALYCFYQRDDGQRTPDSDSSLRNPFELGPALRFAALLVAILLAVEVGRRYLGDAGVYLVAALSGSTDVDAITLSLASSAKGELSASVAERAILLAVVVNSLVKGALIAAIAPQALSRKVLPAMLAGLTLALLWAWLAI